jgi:NAD/FAD-utilizing enzyme apparently involved in cell division
MKSFFDSKKSAEEYFNTVRVQKIDNLKEMSKLNLRIKQFNSEEKNRILVKLHQLDVQELKRRMQLNDEYDKIANLYSELGTNLENSPKFKKHALSVINSSEEYIKYAEKQINSIEKKREKLNKELEKNSDKKQGTDKLNRTISNTKIPAYIVGGVSLFAIGLLVFYLAKQSLKTVDKPNVAVQETKASSAETSNKKQNKSNDFIIDLTAHNDYKGIIKLQDIDKNGDIIKQLEGKLSTMNRDDIKNVEIVDVMHAIDIGDGPLPGNNDKYVVCNDCFDLNPHKQAKILNEVKDDYVYYVNSFIHYKDKPNNPVIYSTYFDKDKLSLVFSFTQSTEISYLNRMKNKFGLPVTGPIQGDDTIILESTEDIK